MKQNIGFSQFVDAFWDTYKSNFSYDGKRALFDYIEEKEADIGKEIELDIVALCCEYSEYSSAIECQEQCQYRNAPERDEILDDDARYEAALREFLRDNTQLIEFDGGIIIQDF
jgi:hypothetical protein